MGRSPTSGGPSAAHACLHAIGTSLAERRLESLTVGAPRRGVAGCYPLASLSFVGSLAVTSRIPPRTPTPRLPATTMALLRGRFGLYALLSVAATYGVLRHAYVTREQFYPAVIYLASSKTSVVVLCNMALVLVVLAAAALKALFLGELRTAEVERVNEAVRFTIPEVCVALTLFREELSTRVVGLFAMLLFSRFFHTVLDERMNYVRGARARGARAAGAWEGCVCV